MSKNLEIVVVGASGRMGGEVIAAAPAHGSSILGGLVSEDDSLKGKELSGVTNVISDTWSEELNSADVMIDFSSPDGAKLALEISLERSIPIVLCTTGLTAEHEELILQVSKVVPMIRASNTSIGVNAMLKIVHEASRLIGKNFDTEIVELHHRYKKDSPSGTALSLAESVADGKGVSLDRVMTQGRKGDELSRESDELGIQAVRGGDVAGEHTVYFFGEGERIEITHRASNRSIFATGAICAAKWLVEQKKSGKSGLFTMADVLS